MSGSSRRGDPTDQDSTDRPASLQRVGERVLFMRGAAYGAAALLGAVGLFAGGGMRVLALVVVAAIALALPRCAPWLGASPVLTALVTDAAVALALWWLFGPVAGVDFLLFYVVAAAALLLQPRAALIAFAVAVIGELAQVPLHFIAESVGLPLFHATSQVVTTGEFLGGVALRSGFIVASAALFTAIARILQKIRSEWERSEAKYRELYEDAPNAYFSIGMDGRVQMANRRACELVGYDMEDLLGRHVTELYEPGPDGVDKARRIFENFRSGGTIQGEELKMRTAQGASTWVSLTVGAVVDDDGEITASRSVVEDISERKEAEEQLRELVRAKDEFVATVSHELRTPLTSVLGFAELLLDEIQDSRERRDAVESIVKEARDLHNIVEDLLVAARAEVGNLEVTLDEVNLSDQVRHVLRQEAELAERLVAVPEQPVRAIGDASRIRQILRNLLSNALRYGGREIRVDAATPRGTAVLRVTDNGPGVRPQDRARIFDAYERATSTPGVTSPVGLGLTVSRHLARRMGGDLTYDYSPGASTFTLELPSVAARRASAA